MKLNSKSIFQTKILILFLAIFGFAFFASMGKSARAANMENKDSPVGKMIFIKGGYFKIWDTFGDGNPDEKPVHEVCVDDFFLGEHKVTQREWRKIMCNNPRGPMEGKYKVLRGGSWGDEPVA